VELIKNEDLKYVRLLGAFYLRLVGKPLDIYQYLEARRLQSPPPAPAPDAAAQPLYNDYRRVRRRGQDGRASLVHVDEVIDELLTKDMVCDIALPRIPHRWTLEASGALAPRLSVLEEALEEGLAAGDAGAEAILLPPPPPSETRREEPRAEPRRRRSRSREEGERYDGDGHRSRRYSRSRSPARKARRVPQAEGEEGEIAAADSLR